MDLCHCQNYCLSEIFVYVFLFQLVFYDRLIKWSKGDFTKIPVPEYKHFDNIPVDKQPAALTEAALAATIGAPLYPGIEMSWC